MGKRITAHTPALPPANNFFCSSDLREITICGNGARHAWEADLAEMISVSSTDSQVHAASVCGLPRTATWVTKCQLCRGEYQPYLHMVWPESGLAMHDSDRSIGLTLWLVLGQVRKQRRRYGISCIFSGAFAGP